MPLIKQHGGYLSPVNQNRLSSFNHSQIRQPCLLSGDQLPPFTTKSGQYPQHHLLWSLHQSPPPPPILITETLVYCDGFPPSSQALASGSLFTGARLLYRRHTRWNQLWALLIGWRQLLTDLRNCTTASLCQVLVSSSEVNVRSIGLN